MLFSSPLIGLYPFFFFFSPPLLTPYSALLSSTCLSIILNYPSQSNLAEGKKEGDPTLSKKNPGYLRLIIKNPNPIHNSMRRGPQGLALALRHQPPWAFSLVSSAFSSLTPSICPPASSSSSSSSSKVKLYYPKKNASQRADSVVCTV